MSTPNHGNSIKPEVESVFHDRLNLLHVSVNQVNEIANMARQSAEYAAAHNLHSAAQTKPDIFSDNAVVEDVRQKVSRINQEIGNTVIDVERDYDAQKAA